MRENEECNCGTRGSRSLLIVRDFLSQITLYDCGFNKVKVPSNDNLTYVEKIVPGRAADIRFSLSLYLSLFLSLSVCFSQRVRVSSKKRRILYSPKIK